MTLDVDVIRVRCQEITQAVERLDRLRAEGRERFLASRDAQDIACYRLIVAIEAALALCYHISARRLRTAPEDYADCFAGLEKAGIIPDTLSGRLQQMALLTSAANAIYGPRTGLPPGSGSQVSRELMDLLAASLPQQGCGLRGAVDSFGPSLPVVGSVRFTDEGRTRAEVGVSTGTSGGSLFLEKDDGVWRHGRRADRGAGLAPI